MTQITDDPTELPMFWRGRAQALRLLPKADALTLYKAETYEECANELKAAISPPRSHAAGVTEALRDACKPWENCEPELPDWESPLMNVWQAACKWTLGIVGTSLGATGWEGGDGSETIEGDIATEVTNIMRAAGLTNTDGDPITKTDLSALASSPAPSEEAVKTLREIEFLTSVRADADLCLHINKLAKAALADRENKPDVGTTEKC